VKAELSQSGIELEERDFFADPFTAEELKGLIGDAPVSDYFSWRSPSFRKMGLKRDDMSDNQMLELMVEEPRLIRRPLIMTPEGKLIVGTDKKAMANLVSG
jgi:Spx/MgsR family transcriptional regulator